MENQEIINKQKKSQKIIFFIIVIFLILTFLFVYFFFLKSKNSNNNSNNNGNKTNYNSEVVYNIAPSVRIGEYIEEPDSSMSLRAVKDDKGIIYYAINSETSKLIYAQDVDGKKYKIWSWTPRNEKEQNENIEIVGIDDLRVIFTFLSKRSDKCDDLWNTDNNYSGVGLGTTSYSGAAGLLLEDEPDLIKIVKAKCNDYLIK